MQSNQKQQGFTFLGFIFAAAIFVFACLAAFKVFPVYMEHFNVTGSLNSLHEKYNEKSGDLVVLNRGALRESLKRLFEVNDVESATMKDVEITQKKKEYTVQVKYDARINFISNIDLLIHFDDKIVVKKRGS